MVFINQFMSINFHYQSIEFNQKMYWSPCLYKYKLLWKLIMKFNVKKKIKASYWTSSTAFVSWRLVHVSWWTTSKVAATRSFRFLWYSVFFKYINRAVFNKSLDNGQYLTNIWFNEGGDHSWLIVKSMANRCLISHKRAESGNKTKKANKQTFQFWQSEYYSYCTYIVS